MLIYRIEHKKVRTGIFQSFAIINVLTCNDLKLLYNSDIYNKIHDRKDIFDKIPSKEADANNLLSEYHDFTRNKSFKFGCLSKEQLLSEWCVNTEEYFNALEQCGFVLAIYDTNDYFTLPSQILYNSDSALMISEKSVFDLLTN